MRRALFAALTALLLVPIHSTGFAATPHLLTFQGRLTNGAGDPINGTRNMTFSLYEEETGGAAVWSEVHTGVGIVNGIYSVWLGRDTPLSPIPFDRQYYLGLRVAPDDEMVPRYLLTSASVFG